MIEVIFPHKDQKRNLMVGGSLVEFRDGKALVTEEQAQIIKAMDNPDYQVVEPVIEVEKPKKARKSKAKKIKEVKN